MMEPVSLVVGAVLLSAGGLAGFVAGRISAARLATDRRQVRPICACKHHRGEHNAEGRCVAEVSRWNDKKEYEEWVPCPCLKYTGPVPVYELWTPPVVTEQVASAEMTLSAPQRGLEGP